jgi:hypothetical protein
VHESKDNNTLQIKTDGLEGQQGLESWASEQIDFSVLNLTMVETRRKLK